MMISEGRKKKKHTMNVKEATREGFMKLTATTCAMLHRSVHVMKALMMSIHLT
jgi:hypothetical protein